LTVLHLVRHGQVENPQKIVYGRQRGWRLSERGRQEAEAVAHHLGGRPVARVYTSPLERAMQTASAIAAVCGCEVVPRDDLSEAFLCAAWEGLRWRDVRARRAGDWARYQFRPLEIADVPEDLKALGARMAGALGAIASAHEGEQVGVVSHGDPLKAGLLALTGQSLVELHRDPIPTGALVSLQYDGGRAHVLERWSAPRN
jgi:probable phosphoglycerate mutase